MITIYRLKTWLFSLIELKYLAWSLDFNHKNIENFILQVKTNQVIDIPQIFLFFSTDAEHICIIF